MGLHPRTREVWTISQANDASTYVFRLLGRQRARAQRLPADALGDALEALAGEKRHALIELELTGGALGRLLIQSGRLVSAHLGDADAQGALGKLRQNAGSARSQTLLLTDEQIALACAALAGAPVALGKEVGASFDSAALILQLGQQYFTGVVALEQGLQTYIRRFQYGSALSTEGLPDRLRATRFTQIVWQEQLLPELGAPQEAASPQPGAPKPPGQAQPAAPQAVQALSAPAPHPAPNPAPDRPAAGLPEAAGAHAAPRERPRSVSETYVEPVFVQAASAVSVQAASAQPFSAQAASAQAASVQAVQAPSALHQAELARATLPVTAQPSAEATSAAATSAADAEAWKRLSAVLDQNMGNRSPRVYKLMHTELGAFSGAELISRLAWQVERIAGAAAARNFRNGR